MSVGWRLLDRASVAVVVPELEVADSEWSRFWGLMFRASLPPGHGLLLSDCGSIHTCFVRFAIDLVMLDAGGKVLAVRRGVWPWRVAFAASGTDSVLELPAGGVEIAVGTSLRLVRGDGKVGPLPDIAACWERASA